MPEPAQVKPTTESANDGGSEYAIEIVNLVKTYGELRAVDGISISIRKGEIFAFLGPNGAGKTTTVEMVEGIRKPVSGEIRIFGKPASKRASINCRRSPGSSVLAWFCSPSRGPTSLTITVSTINLNSA